MRLCQILPKSSVHTLHVRVTISFVILCETQLQGIKRQLRKYWEKDII